MLSALSVFMDVSGCNECCCSCSTTTSFFGEAFGVDGGFGWITLSLRLKDSLEISAEGVTVEDAAEPDVESAMARTFSTFF